MCAHAANDKYDNNGSPTLSEKIQFPPCAASLIESAKDRIHLSAPCRAIKYIDFLTSSTP